MPRCVRRASLKSYHKSKGRSMKRNIFIEGLLKNAHLLCCAANRTSQRMSKYASRFGFLRALHLNIFERPLNIGFINSLIASIILSICLTAGTARAADSFILVSDLDDTVKITDVPHVDNMHCNVVASKLVFAGMPELYKYLLGENYPAGRLMFLSGSPVIFNNKIQELLDDAQFPRYSLTLRSIKEYFSTHTADFKKQKMALLYGASKNEKFMLIGDDTEKDPEVYADFAVNRNDVLAIYIHRITGRNLPQGSISFVTAYDIALQEFKARRLNEKQAVGVGDAVLKSDDNVFLPDFQQCPKMYEPVPGLTDNLAGLKKQIEDRITATCSGRTKASETRCNK
jgi:hypothetical protein